MNGIFSALSNGQNSLFQLQKAKKDWERALEAMEGKDAKQILTEKADQAKLPFTMTPEQQKNFTAVVNALEEAKRVGGPKAVAAQRLDEVERKIEELKMMMRHSRGDREKLVQLAREAAILAKQAGRAAKEYGAGVAAAAEMGLPGGAGAPSVGGITIERTTTRTSITMVQTEIAVDVTVTIRGDGEPGEGALGDGPPPGASMAPAPSVLATDGGAAEGTTAATDAAAGDEATEDGEARSAEAVAAEAAGLAGQVSVQGEASDGKASSEDKTSSKGKAATEKTEQEKEKDRAEAKADKEAEEQAEDGQGSDLERLMSEAAPSLNPAPTAPQGDRIRNYIQRMMADNDLKMSRYREADEFGRRVEAVLATAKSIIAEAKAANELDQAEERRKARRESFKDYDKIVEESQDNVNELRQAAFGSSTTLKDFVEAMTDPNGTDGGSGEPEGSAEGDAITASADRLPAFGGGDLGMPALSGSVNLLA
ncbi:hypothetical protein FBZ82_101249 [Azospirillum brasilense]|uniref:Uncharacterized protein n=1 Tax=Azospirillum brasilense TaxID=192 RepID=A0A560BNN8_AZOBR|nr:hypothetical protein [Azospirillum brasilense]TWA74234.1 hypothetical protein FBZ82_101249 [Azospirillum brasilense]